MKIFSLLFPLLFFMFIFSVKPAGGYDGSQSESCRIVRLDYPTECQRNISRIIEPIYDAEKAGPRWADLTKEEQTRIIADCYEYKKNRFTVWTIFLKINFRELYTPILSWEIKDFLKNVLNHNGIRREIIEPISMPKELEGGDPYLNLTGLTRETLKARNFYEWFEYFKGDRSKKRFFIKSDSAWESSLTEEERITIIENFDNEILLAFSGYELAPTRTEEEVHINNTLMRKIITDFFNNLDIVTV